jgi:hypothetical protein
MKRMIDGINTKLMTKEKEAQQEIDMNQCLYSSNIKSDCTGYEDEEKECIDYLSDECY